jgi:hypothetical protein
MRSYAAVCPSFWSGNTGREIRAKGPTPLLVALYLLTCPTANMIGLYYLPLPTVAHEIGISGEEAWAALQNLAEVGFAFYDEKQEMVWVPRMASFQIAHELKPGDKRIAGVVKVLTGYSNSKFYSEFIKLYAGVFNLPRSLHKPAPSEALQSQDQDQDQDKDQDQDQEKDQVHQSDQGREVETNGLNEREEGIADASSAPPQGTTATTTLPMPSFPNGASSHPGQTESDPAQSSTLADCSRAAAEMLHEMCGQPTRWTVGEAEQRLAPLVAGLSRQDTLAALNDAFQAMDEADTRKRVKHQLNYMLAILPEFIDRVLSDKRRNKSKTKARKDKPAVVVASTENNHGVPPEWAETLV